MKEVAIAQSNYIPWKGYFDLVNAVDEFILYDDMQFTRRDGINTVFHYVPLHHSPVGRKYGRANDDMKVTLSVSERLVRLPLWIGLEAHQEYVIERCRDALRG